MESYTKIQVELEVNGDHDKEILHNHLCKLIHEGDEESASFLQDNVTNISYEEK
jgi:hypothetical protein